MAASSSPPSSQSPPHPSIAAHESSAVDSAPAENAANSALAEPAVDSRSADKAVDSNAADFDDADPVAVNSNAATNADSDSADSAAGDAGDAEAVDSAAAVADPSAAEAAAALSPVIRMKPPPSSWTQQETVTVVQAYGERWYAHKRKPIKGNQWEEIAALVASRGGSRGAGQNPKTPIQCRHKIDKLRKRFRAERHRGSSWNWQYYDIMNRLERGPHPIQAVPAVAPRAPASRYSVRIDANNDFQGNLAEAPDDNNGGGGMDMEEDEDDDENHCNKSQSIHYILHQPTMVNRFPGEMTVSGGGVGVSGLPPPHPTLQITTKEVETKAVAEERERKRVISELASEIRSFAESYVGVENVKMEMMKEGEQRRMEMETRRIGMILDSQKKIAETIAIAFTAMPHTNARKKIKMKKTSQEP